MSMGNYLSIMCVVYHTNVSVLGTADIYGQEANTDPKNYEKRSKAI